MPSHAASLATRYAGRPLLLTPRAAHELANRVRTVDAGAVVRPGRFSALIRRLSGGDRASPTAMEDDDDYEPVPMETRLAYSPLYAGEPDDLGFCWSLKDGVALMQIDKPLLDRGEIFCGEVYHGYDTILQALREADADDRVRGVFIREATPGGVVAGGLPALAEHMRERGLRGGGKPIHVYADMACSAGYWIAASADRIIAPRVGLIGSIGAVIVHENWAGALKEAGIEITPIQFGASKTDGAWWGALSKDARDDLQAEIDQCGRDFVADVIAGRPQLTEAEVLATQAAVYLGHHDEAARSARDLKLIDEIASEEAAFNALRDQVASSSTSSSPPATATSSAAPQGGVAASRKKEAETMATKTPSAAKPAAQSALAKAQAAVRKAQAEVARLTAEAASAEAQDAADEDEEEAAPEAASDEQEEQEAADPVDEGDEDEPEGDTEAEKISSSAEAAAQPAMALAAIKTGQSYAQFKANVHAAASAPAKGQLGTVLAGSPRLGADGKAPTKAAAPASAAATWAKNRAAAGKR